jgi:hypothetical protein
MLYEALPAFLAARTWQQAAGLVILSHVAWYAGAVWGNEESFATLSWTVGTLAVWAILIPALGLVLSRPRVVLSP